MNESNVAADYSDTYNDFMGKGYLSNLRLYY